MAIALVLSAALIAAPAVASPVVAAGRDTADIFIGTLANEGHDLVLTRCDLGDNRYVLVDAQGSTAVADARNSVLPAYGEVIGSYADKNGHPLLKVESIDNLAPGRNCHLTDAVTRMLGGPSPSSNPELRRARLANSLIAATAKYRNRDYAGALAILREAEGAMAADEDATTDFLSRVGFATVEVAYGDTLSAGHLGNACPHYAAARAKALKVQAMAESSADPAFRDIARDLFEQIDKGKGVAACTSAAAGDPDPAFVGHYYLSGVIETGSELLLDANGTFQWFLSYGAVDQSAHGRWHKDGGTIVLTAATPATGKPLFAYLETEPWTAEAEQEVLQRRYEATAAAVHEICPFLTDNWVASPPAATFDDGSPEPSATVRRQQAAIALAKAVAARTRVEAFARQVMGTGASRQDNSASADRAQRLLSDWLDAKGQALLTANVAGLPLPALPDPALPPACTIRPMEIASDTPAGWARGIGVRVVDPESAQGARDVQVLLRFVDGHEEKLVTARSGLAILPGAAAKAVAGATLHADYAAGRDASFTFAPTITGILHFAIDAQQLVKPPFEKLRLTIAGKALIPEEFGRGHYERQP